MSDLSGTFRNWKDRLTYVVAEAQLLVFAVLFSLGVAILWIRPSVPSVPPIVFGWFAALMLLGPPLLALFVSGARKLRNRNMETVYHINGVDDVRRKLYVAPELWQSKTVEGASPYVCNGGDAYEVREFEYLEDIDELRVTGCYMSELADSKLVTIKAMLEDIHGDLVEEFLAANRLRGRISKMGLQIQKDVVNEEAKADERGLMNPRSAVKERFDSARSDASQNATDNIEDVSAFTEDYIDEHAEHVRPKKLYSTVNRPDSPARADGGEE
ncbi:hypothetical protein [Natrinema hispanicum]|uniref:Uncharacterized protein n=1 Tax=Natrinema hispanicum TaxID=392421 RepID=A0A1G6IHL5_9EURY|nr:hypothetical protein [Natrinema hispanicum]SDC06019.1 hypothetical protein SAMN05192552_1001267 [Natrinema hispanicum]